MAADSDEDVFPKWLIKRFKARGSVEHQASLRAVPRIKRPVDSLRIVITSVCETCNNEWMSVLQNDAKPIITALLDSPTCTLDANDCEILALWAVMSTMVLETKNEPNVWRFSDLERCLFHQRQHIPPRTSVWISKWVDSPGPSYVGRILGDQSDRALVTTFGFGSLVFQVLKVVPVDPTDSKTMWIRPELPWDEILLQVWQPRVVPVSYPPPRAIHGESELEALELRFSRPGVEAPGSPS